MNGIRHQDDHPTPSEQDKILIRDQYKTEKLNDLFFLIQGLVGLTLMVYDVVKRFCSFHRTYMNKVNSEFKFRNI